MDSAVIGFLGLGTMGLPMAYNLSKNGYSMVIPAYRKEIDTSSGYSPLVPDYQTKLALINEMLNAGVKGASSLEELAGSSDIIILSMPTSKQVEEVVLSPNGILQNARQGTIVIDMTSADPVSTRKLSQLLAKKGIEMLDAPVSGAAVGAINQALTFMVGGKEEIFEKCRPILETLGEKIIHLGPTGAGTIVKSANNFLSSCAYAATSEAMMVIAKAGISPQKAIEVISNSTGRSEAIVSKYPNNIFPNKKFNFTLNLQSKDIALFVQTAKELKIPAFFSNLVFQVWSIPIAQGKGDEDVLHITKMYEEWSGVRVRGTDNE